MGKKTGRPLRRRTGGVVNIIKQFSQLVDVFTSVDVSAEFVANDIPQTIRVLVILGHEFDAKVKDPRAEIRFRPGGETFDFKDSIGVVVESTTINLDGGGEYESGGVVVQMTIPVSEDGIFEYQLFNNADKPLTIVQLLDVSTNELSNTIRVELLHTDFATAALTNTIDVLELPAAAVVESVIAEVTEVFAGGSITAYDIECGQDDGPDEDAFLISFDATALDFFGKTDAEVGVDLDGAANAIYSTASSTKVQAKATSVGDNLDQATAGKVDIYIKFRRLP